MRTGGAGCITLVGAFLTIGTTMSSGVLERVIGSLELLIGRGEEIVRITHRPVFLSVVAVSALGHDRRQSAKSDQ
jgi:hypothetical protein